MAAGYSFRPRLWPLALAALGCAAGIALGQWQTGRAQQKRALGEQFEQALKAPALEISAAAHAPEVVNRRVAALGSFVPRHTVLLDNKLRAGRPGYEVVTPLRLAGSDMHVLVDRGWLPAAERRDLIPQAPAPAGEVRIEGLALPHLPRVYDFGRPGTGVVRPNYGAEAFVAETGLPAKTFVIEQFTDTHDGLLREWPRPDLGVAMHESYALQWYSLAAVSVAAGLYFAFRRR